MAQIEHSVSVCVCGVENNVRTKMTVDLYICFLYLLALSRLRLKVKLKEQSARQRRKTVVKVVNAISIEGFKKQ